MLWRFIVAGVLVFNALAVLHPERFLSKYGLDNVNHASPTKRHIAQVLAGARSQQVTLIGVNIYVICYEFGAGMLGSMLIASVVLGCVVFVSNVQWIVAEAKQYALTFGQRLLAVMSVQ